MEKSPDAFRTISEVADLLETPAHVLRFWESRFPQVRPVKRAGGRRYYRPSDVALLGGIKRLLHHEGLSIRSVQKLLRDQGVRHVAALAGGPVEDPAETAALAPPSVAAPAPAPRGTARVLPFAPATTPAPRADGALPPEVLPDLLPDLPPELHPDLHHDSPRPDPAPAPDLPPGAPRVPAPDPAPAPHLPPGLAAAWGEPAAADADPGLPATDPPGSGGDPGFDDLPLFAALAQPQPPHPPATARPRTGSADNGPAAGAAAGMAAAGAGAAGDAGSAAAGPVAPVAPDAVRDPVVLARRMRGLTPAQAVPLRRALVPLQARLAALHARAVTRDGRAPGRV